MIEYHLVEVDYTTDLTSGDLNKYGKDGWELITVFVQGQHKTYYFKRHERKTNYTK